MFIEEVIIDGFKSYASRTVISGWDPNFNAITGLNGSGKSNILDAICFVLGISVLAQVRVASLQELVYKQGQAGVTKASVTIVFNNKDKTQSPVGYDSFDQITVTRQVVIGGRNKYLINGHAAQPTRIQNLFHSVQLNVNNPHFLIMQGRITKVLNMKPPEILAMIEETAGTRMFEMKKISALKTIEKKQNKVEEISRLLAEEITPTLERLRSERKHYMEWVNNSTEIERLSRLCIAYDYHNAEETLQRSADELKEIQDQEAELVDKSRSIADNLAKINKEIGELSKKKEKEMSSALKSMESETDQLSKELVRLNAAWQHKKEALEDLLKQKKELEQNIVDSASAVTQKKKQLDKSAGKYTQLETATKELEKELSELECRFQATSVGMSVADAGADTKKTFVDQLNESKKEASAAATEAKRLEMKLNHVTEEIKQKRKQTTVASKDYTKLQAEYSAEVKALEKLKIALDKLDFNETKEKELLAIKKTEEAIVRDLRDKVDDISSRLSGYNFTYSDPERNFDRSRVKGLVANLINLKDPATATALEVSAGARLFNVVVDTEETGKSLLKNGQLKKRVTIIPLNKIVPRVAQQNIIKAAEGLVGREHVSLALALIDYHPEVASALKYCFGNTFVCKDLEQAKTVAFNRDVRTRCVTLLGDISDPAGTMTGGSRPNTRPVLLQLQELRDAKSDLRNHEKKLADVTKQIESAQEKLAEFKTLNQQYEIKAHEVALLEARVNQNTHHQLIVKVEELEKSLVETKASMKEVALKEKNALKRCEDLESEISNSKNSRESRLKDVETKIARKKAELASVKKDLKVLASERERILLESEEFLSESSTTQQQLKDLEMSINRLETEVTEQERVAQTKKTAYEASKLRLDTKKEALLATDNSISGLLKSKEKQSKEATDLDIEIKKVQHNLARFNKNQKDAAQLIRAMAGKHPWISAEKKLFGKAGTDFDFGALNPEKAKKRLKSLNEKQEALSKSINKKVMGLFEKAEQEYQDLKEKKIIIEKDKAKIEAVISELEEKKNEALTKTWQKVNKDFGSIFSTLLPGTTAKLEPPEGKTVLDGLEVKVAFNNVWKESLTPMYILDEIDAALDLSHTQNIGQMLKNHFSQSQFIVVSLKEGMFNNANVLFKTKFVDGISTVTRTTPTHSERSSASAPSSTSRGKKIMTTITTEEKENLPTGGTLARKRLRG